MLRDPSSGSAAAAPRLTRDELLAEIRELRARLEEAEDAIRAIRAGEVDALVVTGDGGSRVFTLQGAEHVYRVMVDAMREGAVSVSRDGTVLYANACFAEMVKLPLERVIGSAFVSHVIAADARAIRDMLSDRRLTPGTRRTTLIAPQGARVPVLLSIRSLDAAEQPALVAVVTDLTELVAATAAQAHLAAIVEASNDAIVGVTPSGMVETWNHGAERLYLYALDEILGRPVWGLVPADAATRLRETVASAARGEYIADVDCVGRRKDGSLVEVSMSASPIWGGSGAAGGAGPAGVSMIHRDVTERKAAEYELHLLNSSLESKVAARTVQLDATVKELESFSYSVSHDLRAPLRAVDGLSQILLEDYADRLDDSGRDLLRRIRRGCQHMGGLIDDLLKLARVTRTELNYRRVDVSAAAQEITAHLLEQEPLRAVEVRIEPGIVVQGDPTLLKVALENLLANAWKFSGKVERARIEVGASRESRGSPGATGGDELILYVRDNGAGFEMAYRDKLFGAFQRLHSARDFDGNGIGLATVQRIVRQHGGRVWAEGVPGHGATFYAALPVLMEVSDHGVG